MERQANNMFSKEEEKLVDKFIENISKRICKRYNFTNGNVRIFSVSFEHIPSLTITEFIFSVEQVDRLYMFDCFSSKSGKDIVRDRNIVDMMSVLFNNEEYLVYLFTRNSAIKRMIQ